jgi:hypothetical protein
MNDESTIWLVVVNVALGAIVLGFCSLVVTGVLREFIERARRRRAYRSELDRDLNTLFRPRRH